MQLIKLKPKKLEFLAPLCMTFLNGTEPEVSAELVRHTAKAALRSVHGVGKIEACLSDYYLAEEIQATYRGMMIAIPPAEWGVFSQMTLTQFSSILQHLATQINLKVFCSAPRGPKKPPPERIHDQRQCHVSTARLLAQAKNFKPHQ